MRNLLLFLCLGALLSGCCGRAESSGPDKIQKRSFLGVTTDELIRIKGAPGTIAILPTGEAVWTYKMKIKGEREQVKTEGITERQESIESVTWIETASYIIDAEGKVKSYTTAVEK